MTATFDSKSATPQPIVLGDENLQVVFRWSGDRFVHTLRGSATQAASVDGDDQTWWPPSPPLQQLSLETIGDADIVFGVGGAGTSHWSVSVEWSDGGLSFDWACKCKDAPMWLGSTYDAALDHLENSGLKIIAGQGTRVGRGEHGIAIQPVDATTAGTHRWSYRMTQI